MIFLFCCGGQRAWARCEHANLALTKIESARDYFAAQFRAYFNDPDVYTYSSLGYCDRHVYRFLKKLALNPAFDLQKVNVLFLSAPEGLRPLFPRIGAARGGTWAYHSVIEYDGQIFDFDYVPAHGTRASKWEERALIDDSERYFAEMYPHEVNLRAYSGDFYLAKYEEWRAQRGLPWAQGFPKGDESMQSRAEASPELSARDFVRLMRERRLLRPLL